MTASASPRADTAVCAAGLMGSPLAAMHATATMRHRKYASWQPILLLSV
jgi:hypothetical protein